MAAGARAIVPAAAPLQLLVEAPAITVYKYENNESPNFTNQLWVREDTGLVMYVSKDGYTEWHGEFKRIEPRMATLLFGYTGNVNDLKQVMLVGMQRETVFAESTMPTGRSP